MRRIYALERSRVRWVSALALVGLTSACSDSAVIGGLCPADCATQDAGQAACQDGSCPSTDGMPHCTAGPYSLTRRQGALYLVIDDSSTLAPQWPGIREALDAFFADGASASLDLGLQLLGSACDPAQYTPVVPIGPVRESAVLLRSAIPSIPMKSSSTLPGLKGALAQARSWAKAHPESTISVLLLTDVLPAECDARTTNYATLLTDAASEGLTGTPPVRTFVVGFGVMPESRDLARAGGTEATIIGQAAAARDILDALQSVRDSAPSCSFTLPDGVSVDPAALGKLSLDGQHSFALRNQASACDGEQGEFYLASEASASVVVACPHTCSALSPNSQLSLWTDCDAGASANP